jgi:hypothetical protein
MLNVVVLSVLAPAKKFQFFLMFTFLAYYGVRKLRIRNVFIVQAPGVVAQLLEQLTSDPMFEGSNTMTCTINVSHRNLQS